MHADTHSCSECLEDDDCPITYRWWCESGSSTSWFKGFALITLTINMCIIFFPSVVLVFGVTGYTGTRARTSLGSGLLWATDYVRGALSLGLIFFLITNLLHAPSQHKTVLDQQFINPELTNYLGCYMTLDNIAPQSCSLLTLGPPIATAVHKMRGVED